MTFKSELGIGESFKGDDGNEYLIPPLSLADWGAFVLWVQYKPYRDAKAADLPLSVCDKILSQCQKGKVIEKVLKDEFKELDREQVENLLSQDEITLTEEELEEKYFTEEEVDIELNSSEVKKHLSTPEGVHKLFHLSLGVNYPKLKDRAINHIASLKRYPEMQDIVLTVNGYKAESEEPEKNE